MGSLFLISFMTLEAMATCAAVRPAPVATRPTQVEAATHPARAVAPGATTRPVNPEALPTLPQGRGWKLRWHDEFNGTTLDDSKWDIPPDARRRDGWWVRRVIRLDGQGHLVMETRSEDGQYLSGCVRTLGKFEHTFGYWVARIRLQRQPGHWPAFWLMGRNVALVGDEGRDGTEIDIMEKPWLDERINLALHWDGYGQEHRQMATKAEIPGVMEGFHTFGLHWTPREYVFYADGREVWRTSAGGPCQAPLYIKLTSEVGKWAGDIGSARLPDEFLVDYVRVYDEQ